MRRYLLNLLLLAALITILSPFRAAPAKPVVDADQKDFVIILGIQKAIDFFYRMDSDLSLKSFDNLINEYPGDPLLYLMKGGICLEMLRFYKDTGGPEIRKLESEAFNLSKNVVELAKKRLKKDPDEVNSLYFLGAAHGNMGRLHMLKGSWLKGFWSGKKGFKLCEKVVKKDPDFHDAYLGLGIFHYFAATAPKFIKPLSFLLGMSGNKNQGISELQIVKDKSPLLAVEARRILQRIYWNENDWEKFYTGSKWLVDEYPENINFQTHFIYALARMNMIAQAETQLEKVNGLINNNPDNLPVGMRIRYLKYAGFVNFLVSEYSLAVNLYQNSIKLSASVSPDERVWAEDYYFLAASFAKLGQKKDALKYLKKAINSGWKKEQIIGRPEWEPYIADAEFKRITGT